MTSGPGSAGSDPPSLSSGPRKSSREEGTCLTGSLTGRPRSHGKTSPWSPRTCVRNGRVWGHSVPENKEKTGARRHGFHGGTQGLSIRYWMGRCSQNLLKKIKLRLPPAVHFAAGRGPAPSSGLVLSLAPVWTQRKGSGFRFKEASPRHVLEGWAPGGGLGAARVHHPLWRGPSSLL